ncbi:hypothetical protein NDU88_003602 [Pleurodeles waltl]|uniref:Uncharacterized protein n=1 Tax=Pleurodeles waltl TaxID=8319 RepID=A0AAV7PA14_PLEWA|nr:hypothetical protein NDU88_003602 [Pleurodeles waltl]
MAGCAVVAARQDGFRFLGEARRWFCRVTRGCVLHSFRIRTRGGRQLGLHCGGVPRWSCAGHEEERRVFLFGGTAAAPARAPG